MTKKQLMMGMLAALRAGGTIRIPQDKVNAAAIDDMFDVSLDTLRGEIVVRMDTKS